MRPAVGVAVMLLAGCGRIGFDHSDHIDGSVDDGVTDAPPAANIVFITSTVVTPGALGGLGGADAVCNQRAAAAHLPGTYVAWLSTTTVSARDRLAGARGWRRPDGQPVADQVSDLTSLKMFYPIDEDETGATVPPGTYVVTFTISSGVHSIDGATSCGDLTSTTGDTWGSALGSGGGYWTSSAGNTNGCAMNASHLYCFGVDQNVAVTSPPVTSRRAFWLGYGWGGSASGIADADSTCQSAADAVPLGGTFRALLATTTASPFSRFDTTGPVWVRLDGVPLAASIAELLAGDLIAPLNLGPMGYGFGGDLAWIGVAGNPGGTTPGTTVTTCSDWSTSAGTGTYLVAGRFGPNSWFGTSGACTSGFPILCLEP